MVVYKPAFRSARSRGPKPGSFYDTHRTSGSASRYGHTNALSPGNTPIGFRSSSPQVNDGASRQEQFMENTRNAPKPVDPQYKQVNLNPGPGRMPVMTEVRTDLPDTAAPSSSNGTTSAAGRGFRSAASHTPSVGSTEWMAARKSHHIQGGLSPHLAAQAARQDAAAGGDNRSLAAGGSAAAANASGPRQPFTIEGKDGAAWLAEKGSPLSAKTGNNAAWKEKRQAEIIADSQRSNNPLPQASTPPAQSPAITDTPVSPATASTPSPAPDPNDLEQKKRSAFRPAPTAPAV